MKPQAASWMAIGSLWLGCVSCTPVVRGGFTVASDASIPGDVIASYDPKPCEDASGASFDWRSRLFVVQSWDGTQRLIEARSQYDKLVFATARHEGDERVFQAALRSQGEPARLHEVRIPDSRTRGGSYRVSLLRAGTGRGEKFRGEPGAVMVTCQLERVSPPQTVDKVPAASKLPPS